MKKEIKIKQNKVAKILSILCLALILFLNIPSSHAAYDENYEEFSQLENPTSEDLLLVADPTVDDFRRLAPEEQQQYLLTEYNSEFAGDYLLTTDFSNKNDILIGQQYFEEEPEHINDDPESFMLMWEKQGVHIELEGPVSGYDTSGNLYGKTGRQVFNLNTFKNSPAKNNYNIMVNEYGDILLYKEDKEKSIFFTGTLQVDKKTGTFTMSQGTINNYYVRGAKHLEFDENGDISGGSVIYYDGITFAESTPIKTETRGSKIILQSAEITSVEADTRLYVSGSARFSDYDTVKGTFLIEAGESSDNYLIVNSVLIYGSLGDIEVRFGDASSEEEGVAYARFTNDKITLNGASPTIAFNSEDYILDKQYDPSHVTNIVINPVIGKVTLTQNNGHLVIDGRELRATLNGEKYIVKEEAIFKQTQTAEGETVLQPTATSIQDETLQVPVDFIIEEEGGVALSVSNNVAALFGTTEKPTTKGVAIQTAEIAVDVATGDSEALQQRIDGITAQLQQGVGISVEDQEFLIALYDGIATGGYVKAGANAGNALRHYFTGNGEQLELDSEPFEESRIVNEVMKSMEEEAKRQAASGDTNGKLKSSTCGCIQDYKQEYGSVIRGGVIETYNDVDTELFYANHNFHLEASWEKQSDGSIAVVWEVNDLYDFKRTFDEREDIKLPILFSDTDISITDGVAQAMAIDLDLAKPYNAHAEWETTIEP